MELILAACRSWHITWILRIILAIASARVPTVLINLNWTSKLTKYNSETYISPFSPRTSNNLTLKYMDIRRKISFEMKRDWEMQFLPFTYCLWPQPIILPLVPRGEKRLECEPPSSTETESNSTFLLFHARTAVPLLCLVRNWPTRKYEFQIAYLWRTSCIASLGTWSTCYMLFLQMFVISNEITKELSASLEQEGLILCSLLFLIWPYTEPVAFTPQFSSVYL